MLSGGQRLRGVRAYQQVQGLGDLPVIMDLLIEPGGLGLAQIAVGIALAIIIIEPRLVVAVVAVVDHGVQALTGRDGVVELEREIGAVLIHAAGIEPGGQVSGRAVALVAAGEVRLKREVAFADLEEARFGILMVGVLDVAKVERGIVDVVVADVALAVGGESGDAGQDVPAFARAGSIEDGGPAGVLRAAGERDLRAIQHPRPSLVTTSTTPKTALLP